VALELTLTESHDLVRCLEHDDRRPPWLGGASGSRWRMSGVIGHCLPGPARTGGQPPVREMHTKAQSWLELVPSCGIVSGLASKGVWESGNRMEPPQIGTENGEGSHPPLDRFARCGPSWSLLTHDHRCGHDAGAGRRRLRRSRVTWGERPTRTD